MWRKNSEEKRGGDDREGEVSRVDKESREDVFGKGGGEVCGRRT